MELSQYVEAVRHELSAAAAAGPGAAPRTLPGLRPGQTPAGGPPRRSHPPCEDQMPQYAFDTPEPIEIAIRNAAGEVDICGQETGRTEVVITPHRPADEDVAA